MSNESTEPESVEDVLGAFLTDTMQARNTADVAIAAGKADTELKILASELSEDQVAAYRGTL